MSTSTAFDSRTMRNVLGQFATGVTIITTRDPQGQPVGMTASSFNALSLEPPLVLWSIDRNTGCFNAFNQCSHFAVHILSEQQQSLSSRFAARGVDKFADLDLELGAGGTPLLTDYCARFECALEHQYEGGDHIIMVGRVLAMDSTEHPPLIFHRGRYASLHCA